MIWRKIKSSYSRDIFQSLNFKLTSKPSHSLFGTFLKNFLDLKKELSLTDGSKKVKSYVQSMYLHVKIKSRNWSYKNNLKTVKIPTSNVYLKMNRNILFSQIPFWRKNGIMLNHMHSVANIPNRATF